MTEPAPHRRVTLPRPLAVISASLATFLAVLALLAAQMHAGRDPALGGAKVALVAGHGGKPLVTRASGGAAAHGSAPVAHSGHHPITTRTSGGGERDE